MFDYPFQQILVTFQEKIHHSVRPVFLMFAFTGKEDAAHHRYVSQRKDKRAYEGKRYRLRHGPEHFTLDALQGKNGNVNDQDNKTSKNSHILHPRSYGHYF